MTLFARFVPAVLAAVAIAIVAVALPVRAESSDPVYRYRHLAFGDTGYIHPTTGETLVQAVANQGLYVGWQLVSVSARYVPGAQPSTIFDFVFLAPVGVEFPTLPAPNPGTVPPPPPPPPSTPTQPTANGTACPGYPNPPFPGARCYTDGGWRP